MDIFSTDRKLLLNDTLRGFFCNAKLISEEGDPEYLQNYSNEVMKMFFNQQLVFFPNVQLMIDVFIIQSGYPWYILIINNRITVSKIPVVQPSVLLLEHDEIFEKLKIELKNI